jgi:Arc/MetJ family transcription regulator
MRTTLTLDDDLVARLRKLAHVRGTSFKAVVNETLRRGLTSPAASPRRPRRVRLDTFSSAFRPGVDPERLNQLVDDLEVQGPDRSS